MGLPLGWKVLFVMRYWVWLGSAVLLAGLFLLSLSHRTAAPARSPMPPAAARTNLEPPSIESVFPGTPSRYVTAPPEPTGWLTNHVAETKDAIIERLHDYGTESEPRFLGMIARELENAEYDIRHAAIEALIQFGSRDAIPILRQQAERVSDSKEKAELTEAADFLALPTLKELKEGSPTVNSDD